MDSGLNYQLNYQRIIKQVLQEHADYRAQARDPVQPVVVFDDEHSRYLLLMVGWDDKRYWHTTPIHIDIIDGKIWIQYDDTEDGVATDLLNAGISKEDIVLGFRSPDVRSFTGFGIGVSQAENSKAVYSGQRVLQPA